MPPAQMVVNIEDLSLVNDIRKALKLMRGIGSVTLRRNPTQSSYERSRADVKAGRVYAYDSLEDFIKEIEG